MINKLQKITNYYYDVNNYMLSSPLMLIYAHTQLEEEPCIHKNINLIKTYMNIDVSVYKITLCLAWLDYIIFTLVL